MSHKDEPTKEGVSTEGTILEAPTYLSRTHSGGTLVLDEEVVLGLIFEDQEAALPPHEDDEVVEFDNFLTTYNF